MTVAALYYLLEPGLSIVGVCLCVFTEADLDLELEDRIFGMSSSVKGCCCVVVFIIYTTSCLCHWLCFCLAGRFSLSVYLCVDFTMSVLL